MLLSILASKSRFQRHFAPEETFDAMDYSHKVKQEFLESLSHEQFEKIQVFFQTMPTVKHEIEIESRVMKWKHT